MNSVRHQASLQFVSGELFNRGFTGNIPAKDVADADLLCYHKQEGKQLKLIVKTYRLGDRSCHVGVRSERYLGDDHFWILAGIPLMGDPITPEYFIIPNKIMAENAKSHHQLWLDTPGVKGQKHRDTSVRVVLLPPSDSPFYWDLEPYRDRWDLLQL